MSQEPAGLTYDRIGRDYARTRRPDPRIAAQILRALGDARSVVNVGAGSGSYEPADRSVVAVEPSATMVRQRPDSGWPVVRAAAEALPFAARSVDAVMAVLTMHHWSDQEAGIAEMRRVGRSRVVCLTWDPDGPSFWLVNRYFPEFAIADRSRFPSIEELCDRLGGATVEVVPVPADCEDGFLGAFWRRPAAYLRPEVRSGMSAFDGVPDDDARLERLADDLAGGEWLDRFGGLLRQQELDIGYRLLIADAS